MVRNCYWILFLVGMVTLSTVLLMGDHLDMTTTEHLETTVRNYDTFSFRDCEPAEATNLNYFSLIRCKELKNMPITNSVTVSTTSNAQCALPGGACAEYRLVSCPPVYYECTLQCKPSNISYLCESELAIYNCYINGSSPTSTTYRCPIGPNYDARRICRQHGITCVGHNVYCTDRFTCVKYEPNKMCNIYVQPMMHLSNSYYYIVGDVIFKSGEYNRDCKEDDQSCVKEFKSSPITVVGRTIYYSKRNPSKFSYSDDHTYWIFTYICVGITIIMFIVLFTYRYLNPFYQRYFNGYLSIKSM